jgi:hypothetical protein
MILLETHNIIIHYNSFLSLIVNRKMSAVIISGNIEYQYSTYFNDKVFFSSCY